MSTVNFSLNLQKGFLRLSSGRKYNFNNPKAFSLISKAWIRAGWDTKYVYSFTWLGRPIIQLPEDMLRIQELIYTYQPDIIIETGVAHGGSLIFYASLLKMIGKGRVIGVDINIRPANKKAILKHKMKNLISLVQGDSVNKRIIQKIKRMIGTKKKCLVILDSCHTKQHVLAELEAYSSIITPGGYIIACDGIMSELVGAPRSKKDWAWNNPLTSIHEFLRNNRQFKIVEPQRPFNEGAIQERVTYWPSAFLQKVC